MIERLSKNIAQFYQISLIAVMLSALGVVFYFWKLGFIDGSRSKELHKAGFTLEMLLEGEAVPSIKSSIEAENHKESLDKIDALETQMLELHRLAEDQGYQSSIEELQRLKVAASNLISFQRSSAVISVFNNKMEKFADYVSENNWRTLTRMSQRVLSRSRAPLNGELSQLVSSIEKDFDSMVRITENSILSRPDKAEIKSRISSLRVEVDMLKKYLDERALSLGLADSFQERFAGWLASISPELSVQKLQVERMGRYYVMGMLGILALTCFLFFSGFVFNRYALKRAQTRLETEVKDLIADGILGKQGADSGLYDKEFVEFVNKTAEYVDKRMRFGAIFQEALPFSAIMLDKNLKVEWTNKRFCEEWEIGEDEAGQDYMSWDYLAKLTNLGHDDPVLEALKHDVAGIYQIQVKPAEDTETRPYEMFVSPVRSNNEKKIMLFFYPLLSMRETIKNQAVSIVNPIDKTLRLMKDDAFAGADKEQLRKEYEVGGIARILDMFETLEAQKERDRKALLNQVESLYRFIEDSMSKVEEAYNLNTETFSISKTQVEHLKAFKDGVMGLAQAAKNLETFCSELDSSFGETMGDLDVCHNDFMALRGSLEDLMISMPDLGRLKDEIKEQRTQAAEAKSRLGQGLAGLIHIKKGISHPLVVKKFQEAYDKVYETFERMDRAQIGLDKKLAQMEINLSKAQLLLVASQKLGNELPSSQDSAAFKSKREQRAQLRQNSQAVQGQYQASEEAIVESLRGIYQGQKESLKNHARIAKALELSEEASFARGKAGAKASSETGESREV